jgi:uncharacterized protein YuzE
MKIEYDAAHDLLNIEFLAHVAIDDSLEIDGVVIDYAKDKRIVAIEVLDACKRTTRKPLDLTNLAIVKSTGSDGVRESAEKYGKKRPAKTKRRGSRSK